MAKPIKRSEHIIQLSREHHFSLLFGWKIRKGVKKEIEQERIIKYILFFWKTHLLPHFSEEDILFEHIDDELVQRAHAEHLELNTILESLSAASFTQQASLIPLIANSVENHVRFEERELFPHLERAIPESQLAIIGKQLLKAQPEPLQDDYDDEFWK